MIKDKDTQNVWNAGRVTIPTSEFLEFIAAKLDRLEGREIGSLKTGGVDYCIRLRELAAAGKRVFEDA